ncbi:polysaccharide deacetylase family protein [Ottowia oryzae]|uniref:Polysaccharide deacetylase family protein n=1 Tax=Ottowia oryzae TaxID=2109914 RepID=A0A2S0MG92_9BURK|nr:polysaccharide deacetylase family protein [Ottowia oryzae]AVO34912.1 polysaccharide deacetylase family protein [Ottowia oryzae]
MAFPLPPATPWRPSLFLRLSAALHGLALLAVLAWPSQWPVWLGWVVANHVILATAGLWPRSRLLGANLTRLPPEAAARGEVALTFDDGPDPLVTPQVLAQLDAAGARATFFCVGDQLRRHPDLARDIVRRGHHIENHTDTHPNLFAAMGWRRMAQQVAGGQAAVEAVTGRAPRFFRAVAGLRNPWLDPILARQGLRLAAWTRRGYDTRTGDAEAVYQRLTRGLAAGDVLLMHDGHAAPTPSGQPVVLAVLPRVLAALQAQGLRCVPLADAVPETTTMEWRGITV